MSSLRERWFVRAVTSRIGATRPNTMQDQNSEMTSTQNFQFVWISCNRVTLCLHTGAVPLVRCWLYSRLESCLRLPLDTTITVTVY